jgi:hypothetical protein
MTYLELVNAVLIKLREDTVGTVNESEYSAMIGAFVNDAKQLVEDAWDWTALRDTTVIDTISGTATYSLVGYTPRSKIISVHNLTDSSVVRLESLARIRQQNLHTNNLQGAVSYYTVDGIDSNGDLKIRLYPTPDAIKTIEVYGIKRPRHLVDDADTTFVPSSPIVHWAYAYALRERGETGGQAGGEQAIFAQNDLATAISLDAANHQEELLWDTV